MPCWALPSISQNSPLFLHRHFYINTNGTAVQSSYDIIAVITVALLKKSFLLPSASLTNPCQSY